MERKFVKFQVPIGFGKKKVILILLGLGLMFTIASILKPLLMLVMAKRFVYAIISNFAGLFITFIYPSVIKRFS